VVFLQLHNRWQTGGLSGDAYRDFDTLGEDLLTFALDVSSNRYD